MYGDEESSTSEYEQYVCPYLITAVQPDSSNSALSMGALMAVIGAVLVGAVVFVTIKSKRVAGTDMSPQAVQYGDVPYPEQDSTLMNDMAKLHQPEDNADEFFNRPIKPHETSDSDNGLGIGIDDK